MKAKNPPKYTPPFFPIVYVRGFAMTDGEIVSTTSTPYMGFNDGSTKFREDENRKTQKFYFESPLIRLMRDRGYTDGYRKGRHQPAESPAPCVVICRYYDPADPDFGDAGKPTIADGARRLARLIVDLKNEVGASDDDTFRVHLVAHSMGGLVCRKLLQNPDKANPYESEAAQLVDKVFTYATPHGGVRFREINGVGSLAAVLTRFEPSAVAEQMGLPPGDPRSLAGRFPVDNFFCLVGTNHADYPSRLVRTVVGPGSDGLVLVNNAILDGCPKALVHRSHSGPHGIVNSEEGYRNLDEFLFGPATIRGSIDIDHVPIGPKGPKGSPNGPAVVDVEVRVTRADGTVVTEHRSEDSSEIPADVAAKKWGFASPRVLFTSYVPCDLTQVDGQWIAATQLRVELCVMIRGIGPLGKARAPMFLSEVLFRGSWMVEATRVAGTNIVQGQMLNLETHWPSELGPAQLAGPDVTLETSLESPKGFAGTFRVNISSRGPDSLVPRGSSSVEPPSTPVETVSVSPTSEMELMESGYREITLSDDEPAGV